VIVVRHAGTIRELAASLPGCHVVTVLVTASPSTRRKRLLVEGLEESEIARRLAEDEDAPGNDRSDADLYRWRIENESSVEEFHQAIAKMLACAPGH
jgi:ribose 1,5-bisphosphokinase PhnN